MLETTLTRRELHDLVWSMPIMKLAERFGMSGRGFAELCERHQVPPPPRGYWNKVGAGHTAERPAFVEIADPEIEPVAIGGHVAQERASVRRLRQRKLTDSARPPRENADARRARELEELLASSRHVPDESEPERKVRRTTYLFRVTSWSWNYVLDQDAEALPSTIRSHDTDVLPDFEHIVLSGILSKPPRLKGQPVTFQVGPTRPLAGIRFSDSSRAHVGSVTIEPTAVLAEALVPEGVGTRLCQMLTTGRSVEAGFVTERNDGRDPEPIVIGLSSGPKRNDAADDLLAG